MLLVITVFLHFRFRTCLSSGRCSVFSDAIFDETRLRERLFRDPKGLSMVLAAVNVSVVLFVYVASIALDHRNRSKDERINDVEDPHDVEDVIVRVT